jgi:Xaa-Pro aminopeptidase
MASSADLSGLVFFGNLSAGHDIRYLTAWPPGWDSYLILPTDGRPRLLVPSENHVPNARALAPGFVDVRWVGADPAGAVVAAVLDLCGPRRGRHGRRLGIIGPLPVRIHDRIVAGLEGYDLSDASARFTALRLVKGPAEIEQTRRAAALADIAVRTLLAELRPGLREFELGAIIEATYRRAGGEHGICFLAATSMRSPDAVVPRQVWSWRRVRAGDMVMFELSVGVAGCTSQVLRTISLGEPTAEVRRLHDIADRTFRAIEDRVRPGTTAASLLEAAAVIDDAGCTVVDDVVHGYGGGYLPPVLRTPATQRRPPADLVLAPGMFLVVQPNVVNRDRSVGVQTGELLLVTETGHERFHGLPNGLLQV